MVCVKPREILLLVADDDPEIRSILRKHAEHRGMRVVEAANGEEAVTIASRIRPHVYILDVMMPRMSGWLVTQHVTHPTRRPDLRPAIGRDLGIIMLTAVGTQLNEAAAQLYGADAHMDKPFDLQELFQVVERVLRERCGLELSI